MKDSELFTIGHSTHSIEFFMELLNLHNIEAIADVRSMPYSKYSEHFNRDFLKRKLKENGISYVFMGNELGARRKEENCYIEGKVSYNLVEKTDSFQTGVDRIIKGSEKTRIAMMCSEKDPLTCHRTILVAKHIAPKISTISHILNDGSLEDHSTAEQRLMKEYGKFNLTLPGMDVDPLEEAYQMRASQIAYNIKTEDNEIELH